MEHTHSTPRRLVFMAAPLVTTGLGLALALSACGSAAPTSNSSPAPSTGTSTNAHLSSSARTLADATALSRTPPPPPDRATCSLRVIPRRADFETVDVIRAKVSVLPPTLPPLGYPSFKNPKVYTLRGYYIGPVPQRGVRVPDIWRETVTNELTAQFAWPRTEPGVFLITVVVEIQLPDGSRVPVCSARQTIYLLRAPVVPASATPTATAPLSSNTGTPTPRPTTTTPRPTPLPTTTSPRPTPRPTLTTPRPTTTSSTMP